MQKITSHTFKERLVTDMKALLLKDIKVLAGNMKLYFILILLYILLGGFVPDLGIFQLYPILLFSLFPVTALSYDERCHWTRFGITLPVSRSELVLSKYILGIAGAVFIALFTLAVNLLFPILFQNTVTDFRLFWAPSFCSVPRPRSWTAYLILCSSPLAQPAVRFIPD